MYSFPKRLLILAVAASVLAMKSYADKPSAQDDSVTFSGDFDRGCLGEVTRIGPDRYRIQAKHWHKRDGIGDQYYWFYFRLDGGKGRTITIELVDLEGVYRGKPHKIYTDYTQPVFSYDQKKWHRITDVQHDESRQVFRFTQKLSKDCVWIAYAHPYPWCRFQELVKSIADHPAVRIETVAQTREGRPVQLVTLTDPDVDQDEKKTILMLASQHSGEDASTYLAEGAIRHLLSDDPAVRDIRRAFIFHFVPVMNPDGLFRGISRYNAHLEDLNSVWLNSDKPEPEVEGMKRWTRQWYDSGRKLDVCIDVHCHSQKHRENAFITVDKKLDSAIAIMGRHWPVSLRRSGFKGSAKDFFSRTFDIPAATLELTQSHTGDGAYLTIEDYHGYGHAMIAVLTK